MGTVLQVNVGRPQTVMIHDRPVKTAIVKEGVDGPVLLAGHRGRR